MKNPEDFTMENMKADIAKAGNLFYQYRACRRDASIIYDIENNRFEENDFDKNKTEILKLLYHIKICRLQQYNQVDNLEERLYEIMGENFILYIPPESELVKKLKNMYNSYY